MGLNSPHTGTRYWSRTATAQRKSLLLDIRRAASSRRSRSCSALRSQANTCAHHTITMSHERRTRSTPGADEFAASPPPSAQQFAKTSSGFQRENPPLTLVERWAIARSDDSFRALAGAAGGFMSGVVTCPLDVIKTKLQAQGGFRVNRTTSNVVYQGLIGTGRVIWREEGLRGLYRGLGPIVLGYLPTWAVWFTVYGRSKEFFSKYCRTSLREIELQETCANQ